MIVVAVCDEDVRRPVERQIVPACQLLDGAAVGIVDADINGEQTVTVMKVAAYVTTLIMNYRYTGWFRGRMRKND